MGYFEISDIEQAIRHERRAQDARWGEQNHPDLDLRDIPSVTRSLYAFRARRWQEINAERAQPTPSGSRCAGCPKSVNLHTHTAWDGVLLEEVYEALAEDDPTKLRAELLQVAAVAVAWIEAIDRRTPAPASPAAAPAHGGPPAGDQRIVDGPNGCC